MSFLKALCLTFFVSTVYIADFVYRQVSVPLSKFFQFLLSDDKSIYLFLIVK